MAHGPAKGTDAQLDRIRLEEFARQVLLNLERKATAPRTLPPPAAADLLLQSVLSAEALGTDAMDEVLTLPDLSANDIIDHCIPEVARRAGEMWVEDELSFVQVTLIGARLHALCKALSDEWAIVPQPTRLNVVVATAPGEQHMIGAVVLASQLRRWGASVKLLTGVSEGRMIDEVASGDFDSLLISAANRFTLDTSTAFLSKLRTKIEHPPRLVIGGAIVGGENISVEGTGADLITSDFQTALRGLRPVLPSVDLSAAQ